MAHFAKIGIGNIVEDIVVVNNDVATNEQTGVDFLKSLYGSDTNWKQTSYNTFRNEHKLGGTPFRKNYAIIGGKYDPSRDAFYLKNPYPSWRLNETTCEWEAPVTKPTLTQEQIDNDQKYVWNEKNQTWDLE